MSTLFWVVVVVIIIIISGNKESSTPSLLHNSPGRILSSLLPSRPCQPASQPHPPVDGGGGCGSSRRAGVVNYYYRSNIIYEMSIKMSLRWLNWRTLHAYYTFVVLDFVFVYFFFSNAIKLKVAVMRLGSINCKWVHAAFDNKVR